MSHDSTGVFNAHIKAATELFHSQVRLVEADRMVKDLTEKLDEAKKTALLLKEEMGKKRAESKKANDSDTLF
jgi:hypothetical protein